MLYSNGNCAVRKFGIPTVNVPMDVMTDTKMPVNLLFATKAYRDNELFGYAYAFEQAREQAEGGRAVPGRTPALPTDEIVGVPVNGVHTNGATGPKVAPRLVVTAKRVGDDQDGKIEVSGSVDSAEAGGLRRLEVFVDGVQAASVGTADGAWTAVVEAKTRWEGRPEEKNVPDPNSAMVVVLAVAHNGRAAGELLFV